MIPKIVQTITISVFLLAGSTVFADSDAEKLLKNRMRTPLFKTEGTLTGEGLCWHAAYDMGRFLEGYRKTEDTAFLDAAVQYFDALIGKMHVSPDGYKGWVGPYIYDENYICDVHIGDAILINPMLEFSELVLKQSNAEIRQTYRSKAEEYVALAKKHLMEKWDKRGTWNEDGPYGAYRSWDRYMTEDNLKEWRALPVQKSSLSLPFNKQNAIGLACLRLYRITGENPFRERAVKIFNFMKSRMCLYQDHYVWNYWEPFGEWDIDRKQSNKLHHWVNVHPYRNYQAGEINQIVEAYHTGVTFTQEDLERIINTNLKVMWNGDRENPEWKNSNYAVEMASLGKVSIAKAPGGHFPDLAGTLWRGLAGFDSTIRELAKIESSIPPSFERKYTGLPVTEFEIPLSGNCYFVMAAAVPADVSRGENVHLIANCRCAGPVEIALYSKDGTSEMKTIRIGKENDRAGYLIVTMETNGVPSGQYRIRWTQNGQYREFPIRIE